MRISDWSSDGCSSDLERGHRRRQRPAARRRFALEGGGRGPARRHQGEGDRHRRHRAEGRAGLMAFSSLRDFIDRLERAGRLQRVSAPVSPELEMTEIQTRLLAEGGPAVLFENVIYGDGRKAEMPVLVNLFGTVERVAWGMDSEPQQLREVGETLASIGRAHV